jgi:Flp pilus assembly protein protease CpaA
MVPAATGVKFEDAADIAPTSVVTPVLLIVERVLVRMEPELDIAIGNAVVPDHHLVASTNIPYIVGHGVSYRILK